MAEAIVVMTEKALGCLGVVDARRHAQSASSPTAISGVIWATGCSRAAPHDIMTPGPKTVAPDLLASAALEMINASSITALFVVEDGRPVGVIHIHDLLRAGVA